MTTANTDQHRLERPVRAALGRERVWIPTGAEPSGERPQPSATTIVVAAARTTRFTMPPTRTKSPKR